MGGPIIKDRLFYFFTYDGFRKVGKALYTDSNNISLTPCARSIELHQHRLRRRSARRRLPRRSAPAASSS